MIHGIGTDIVAVKRMADYWQRHGERGWKRCWRQTSARPAQQSRSGAFSGQALRRQGGAGQGARHRRARSLLLPDIAITHDELGKPSFAFAPPLAAYLANAG